MKTIKMRYGTSYFKSMNHAFEYYRPYGYSSLTDAVTRKLEEGEIHIGMPKLKEDETGIYDKDGRFEVTVWDNK